MAAHRLREGRVALGGRRSSGRAVRRDRNAIDRQSSFFSSWTEATAAVEQSAIAGVISGTAAYCNLRIRPMHEPCASLGLQLVQRDRQVAHAFTGRMVDRVCYGRRNPDDADLTEPLDAQ